MRRLLTLTLAVLSLTVPAAAEAATVYVVRGKGWGHGTGMSQYGAFGFAQNGFTATRILAHYYRGTQLATAPSRPVRVLLQASRSQVRFRGATRAPSGRRLNPAAVYAVRPAGGGRLTLTAGDERIGTFAAPLRVDGPRPLRLLGRALNGLSGGLYRGALELHPGAAGGVTAVNSLPIDAYVQGVVPGEMPSSWAIQALRAQAVAARTYALATRKSQSGIFDQYPDTRSQVYRGLRAETARTNQAVRETAREILVYDGRPAVTYFFSTSGGRTENVEFSFEGSEPKPWLKSVADPYDSISPRHRWRVRFSARRLGARLGAPGSFRKIRVLKRGRSPRIVRARVYGSRGTRILTGRQIRARLDLNDTWAYFTRVTTTPARRAAARAAGSGTVIAGVFDPAPRALRLTVERRHDGRWRAVRELRTSRRGRYRASLRRGGVYRVRAGAVAGPAVRVRG